jgi:hypothetical protein
VPNVTTALKRLKPVTVITFGTVPRIWPFTRGVTRGGVTETGVVTDWITGAADFTA